MSDNKKIQEIKNELSRVMLEDKYRILKKLEAIEDRARKGLTKSRFLSILSSIEKKAYASALRREKRLFSKPDVSCPTHLPIYSEMQTIIGAMKDNQVVIISGDTGSGKSTQIPKMCLEAGQGIAGKIGCTQPRRIAATSIARRIAEELGENVGASVGYKIRFTDTSSPDAYIKILTDGMLLAETQKDPLLSEYDTVIIDEAHERSLNIDFLLGILRTLLPRRKDLKVVITSATMDTEKFSEAFNSAPVIEVKGRMYPVEIEYMSFDPDTVEGGEITHVDMAVKAVEQIRNRARRGDILIFMPTEADIRYTCELLKARRFPDIKILPLFARLTAAQQKQVFSAQAGQKIVVATNIAETSLTIPGIKYVIDTGLARIPRYTARTRTTNLPISPISKSSADQRMGRCGRVEKGVCIRLYSEEDYVSRNEFTPPEILRSNLAEVILRMLSLNLEDISLFPFLDKPSPGSIKDGIDLLVELGAVKRRGKRLFLTQSGMIMARMPLDPKISRMMLEALKEGCVAEVAVIASVLSIQDPLERPMEKSDEADMAHAFFKDRESDFVTLLNIWSKYHEKLKTLRTQNKMRKFCKENFLSYVRMREWLDIHQQIISIMKEQRFREDEKAKHLRRDLLYAKVHRCILSGYLSNIATKSGKNIYLAPKGKEVMLFPGSGIFNRGFQWIVAAEMIKTSRLFARTSARIDPQWLEPLGGLLCRYSYSQPHWDKDRGEVMALEKVKLFGLTIISGRKVPYAQINPEESHEIFVMSALVEGQVKENFEFLAHNRDLVENFKKMEDKMRRKDLVVGDDRLAEIYSEKIPGVNDISALNRRIKEMGNDEFLKLNYDDILITRPDESLLEGYPDYFNTGSLRFPMSYRFAPGTEDDGVTVSIPSTLACEFPAQHIDWMVPGLLNEKISELIKGLPKRYRKQLVPVSKTAEIICDRIKNTDEPLIRTLSRFIYREFGVDIPESEWPVVHIPEYLNMRFSITDQKGHELISGRGVKSLREYLDTGQSEKEEPDILKSARKEWEISGITNWNFGTIPEKISLGTAIVAYPGLLPGEREVSIRLFSNSDNAVASHLRGVETLFSLYLHKELKFLKRIIKLPDDMSRGATYFGGIRSLEEAIYKILLKRLFRSNIRTEQDFYSYADEIRPALVSRANHITNQAKELISAFYETRSKIHSLEEANRSSETFLELSASIREHLEQLVPRNFLEVYSEERLANLPRYLKAIRIRAERGAYDVEKDRKKAAEAAVFTKMLKEMVAESSMHMSKEKAAALEEYRWRLEEYRVSLFAPELKTPFPVSQKRLRKKAEEIRRMV